MNPLLSRVQAVHHGTEAAQLRPDWPEAGVPLCDAECPLHDGKRCRALGRQPGPVCEPAVQGLVTLLDVLGSRP